MVKIVNDENFEEEIESGRTLVELFLPGCSPCKKMKEQILPDVEQEIKVIAVDGMANPNVLMKLSNDSGPISSVPVLCLYDNGAFVKRKDGGMSLEAVREFIK
jgi:thioredoxin 1